ncbi:hypothetical protein GCM10007147_03540 [Nocardiopsis kunsanensis]|uniref:Uncharacterized protein n=1 Tax=Nocardiopsis kunsanensis TaxID=141693 RepID=A0A918X7Q4_9ACTN|nr:hypothetical protein GCM10007147_03540 [Nocardiopsis kunsanensis]
MTGKAREATEAPTWLDSPLPSIMAAPTVREARSVPDVRGAVSWSLMAPSVALPEAYAKCISGAFHTLNV